MKILGENTKLKRIVLSLEHIKDFCGARWFATQAHSALGSRARAEESHCRGRPPAQHFTKCPKKGANWV